jgi:DedD protein
VVEPAARPAPQPAAAPEPKPAAKSEPATKAEDAAKARTAADEAARAKALLEGKAASKPDAAKERVVVQVGAFAEASGARTVRLKLEAAGLKTYTHVAETSEGKRIRVRLGPFDSRAEAEKAAARVKALGLPAAILTL